MTLTESGEREVPEKVCEGYGKCAVCDEAPVEISYDLARRVLAAVEEHAAGYPEPNRYTDLAAELRAAVGTP